MSTLCVALSPSSFAAKDKYPLRLLEASGVTIKHNPYHRRLTEAEIIDHLDGVDGLIAGLEPLNRKVLTSAPRLKAIARVGIGVANIDFDAAKELDISVSNTPEGPTVAVAEMTVGAMLALCRGFMPANAALHRKEWNKQIGIGLGGTNVLFIGYGRIGQRVATFLKPFGANILVYDPYLTADDLTSGEQLVGLDEGLQAAEVISLHASGRDPILTSDAFGHMRDGVRILNSARGELIDEAALVQALEAGKVSGAWLDVFWEEPYTGPLTAFEQVLLTPHISTYTLQCRRDMESAAVANLFSDLGIPVPELNG